MCLLIVEFRPFTFKQIIDKCGNAIAILLVAFWLFCSSSPPLLPLPCAWWHSPVVCLTSSVCRYPLYICYRLLLCGYHEVYIKTSYGYNSQLCSKHTKVLHFYTLPHFMIWCHNVHLFYYVSIKNIIITVIFNTFLSFNICIRLYVIHAPHYIIKI